MSKINPVQVTPARTESAHLNFMGGPSWDISNPLTQLRIAAASCFFGEPQYYKTDESAKTTRDVARDWRGRENGKLSDNEIAYLRDTLNALDPQEWRGLSPADTLVRAIDAALNFDAAGTLAVAAALRTEDYIRTTPQVIMVRAANHPDVKGTGLVREFAPSIIRRADEPALQLAYQLSEFGKPIPNSLKKAWKDAYERYNDYGLAKYKGASRTVKSVDVVNLAHPKSESVNKLVNGELKLTDETWESYISANGSTKENWESVIPRMGHMALLRNLRNFGEKGVAHDAYIGRLIETQPGSMQLPFRYFSAHKALPATTPGLVRDAVEECLMNSFSDESMPHFAGRTASLCDNSGSAHGAFTSKLGTMTVAQIANLTGVITGMMSDEAEVGIFGDNLSMVPVRKKASVFDQVDHLNKVGRGIGGSTEHGIWLFWDRAIKEEQHWDNVFVYSDMQAGHGGLFGNSGYSNFIWPADKSRHQRYIDVPKLINEYRSKVNPNVNVFLVQVAGYTDTIVPEYYDRTYILGGWGEGILKFASKMADMPSQ